MATDDPGVGADRRVLLAGTAQNVIGLVVYVLGTFGANVLIARGLGGGDGGAAGGAGAVALGIVTLATQFAFVAAAGTRFGMDMAAVREVAIQVGQGHGGRIVGVVGRSVAIAAAASLVVAIPVFAFAGQVAGLVSDDPSAVADAIRWAAVAIPFVAVTFVSLGASRGLKIMRHTLFVQWIGQPMLWIVLMVAGWATIERTATVAVAAYAASWLLAALGARVLWGRESRAFGREPAAPGEIGALLRYGAPRAPAALLSQGLFWVDYFVASVFVARGAVSAEELGVYSSSVRVALAMVLFLTAVSYVFSPFVADLHQRGERERLDHLFKSITRWTVAGTIPILLLMAIAPGPLLALFGSGFEGGATALRILILGQAVNVAVGAAGFVLIMAGRTGWDLGVYAASFALDLVLAIALVPALGVEGAAIAQAVTIAASNAVRLALVRRAVGIWPYERSYLRLAVPTVACAVGMLGTHAVLRDAVWAVELIGTAIVGLAIYVPAVLAVGLPDDERATVLRVLRRGRAARAA